MNRELWLNKNLDGNFQCPHCKKGYLKLGEYKEVQTVKSKKEDEEIRKAEMGPSSNIQYYYFWANLKCNKCPEIVLCGGESWDSIYFEGNEDEPSQLERLSPKIFMPLLEIIKVPQDTPDKLKEEINKSFELFWINQSSCANSIRKVLELFMDEEKIPREGINRYGKVYHLDLHKRLEQYKKVDTKLLLAVKYIGNAGSHSETTNNYVLDGYELLEYVLDLIFSNKQEKYTNFAKKIIEDLQDK